MDQPEEPLDSWKEIAVYLDRGVRTVQRWEKEEGLPVQRHLHDRQGSIYAYRSEIDAWLANRSRVLGNGKPGWFRFFWENKKTVAGVAGGVTLSLLVGLVAWMVIGSSSNPEGLDFQLREWVLVADFENRTGEAVFDGVLESALRREISNSQFVNVVPRERINDTLELMRRPLDTAIDPEMGREICLRDGGIKALLTGRVEKLDSTYLLSVELVDPSTGQTIAATSQEAAGQGEVLTTLSRLSSWSRETLGEKLTDIREGEEQLERVTTPSLRALQLFTKAEALFGQGGRRKGTAEELLKQAIEIDPEFASAHIFLAWAIQNQGKPAEEFLKHAARALQLAETTGDRERYFIQGSYYHMKREPEKAVQAYETLLSLHPDHYWAINNLANYFSGSGQGQRALPYLLRRAELRPTSFAANSSAVEQLLLADHNLMRAKPYSDRARNLITTEMLQADGNGRAIKIMLFPAYEAWLGGNPQAVLAEIDKVLQTLERVGVSGKLRGLGHLYEALGQRQLAREWMSTARWRSNRHWFLSRIAFDEGDYEAMKNHLKQHLEATKVSGAKLNAIVAIQLARADLVAESEGTLLELERRETTRSRSPSSHQQTFRPRIETVRGVLKLSQGETAEGIAMLESTLPLVSGGFRDMASAILAEAYTRQGNLQAAIQLVEEASERFPISFLIESPSLWLRLRWQLADLYRQTGRAEDTREIEDELRKRLALADADHPILRQLDRTEELALLEPTN